MTPHLRSDCDLCRRYPQPPPHPVRVWSQRRGDETIGLTIDELIDPEKEKKEMSDEQIVEVIERAITVEAWDDLAPAKELAVIALATLRTEGFEVYRPICTSCGGNLASCFRSKIKCCPDCAHFSDRLVPVEDPR